MARRKVKACSCGSMPDLKVADGVFFDVDELAYRYKCDCCGKHSGIHHSEEDARKAWGEEADAV